MSLLILTAEDVYRLLPVQTCIDLMDRAMRAVSDGSADLPDRVIAPVGGAPGQHNHLFAMPGALDGLPVYGAKLVSSHPGNPSQSLPAFQGFVALFDARTGTPAALVDGAAITGLRTASASALASRELARTDASSHGILGTGLQAREHALAMQQVRNIQEVRIWGRSRHKAETMAAELADKLADSQHASDAVKVRACAEIEDVAACDIVSATTGAAEPVLRGGDVHAGAHINLVGSHSPNAREADSALMARAAIYCDRRASLMSEAGDVLIPMEEGCVSEAHIIGEIGQLLNGTIDGRRDDQQVTVYKSLGVITQDLVAAEAVWQRAVADGIGSRL